MQEFNYHSHTYRCKHAEQDYSDEEYVKDYIKMGFKRIAFTDHVPEKRRIDKRTKMRMAYSEKDEYYESIQKLKEKYADKIEIQSGFEVEYLPDEVENLRELKAETDKIILGQHFVYKDDNEDLKIIWNKEPLDYKYLERYANYIEDAMRLNIPDIVAHPDLFMVAYNEFGKEQEKATRKICESAQKYGIPLEINLNGIFARIFLQDHKLITLTKEQQIQSLNKVAYPCRNFWEIASEYDIKVVYGLDTHYRGQIDLYHELLDLAHIIIGEETIKKLNFVNIK
jgi:histidinol-phosphatase (PHP family)